jgi:hypothetical protein
MHVALIVDEERLAHEQPTLNRLAIGLIGDGAQVTRIVPESFVSQSVDRGEQRVALASRIPTPMTVLPWMRADRTSRLAESMEKGPPDVLYAMGERAWDLGRDLARRLERPLAIDVWSADQIRRVPRGRRAAPVAAYVTPTRPMAEALRQRIDADLVCHVPMGVAVPSRARSILAAPDQAIALAIIGTGRDVPAYRALLGGLSRAVQQMPQIQSFIELDGPNEHEIWRHARRLELLENVSALTDASQHRALLTRCDLLLVPEQFGDLRSIMLEAMAFGMPVLAANDPFLDMLEDGTTAAIVEMPDAEAWARQLRRLLTEPETARALGAAGRDRVAAAHRSSDQVAALVETFERITSGGTYRFPE